jgi:hypothetical protein
LIHGNPKNTVALNGRMAFFYYAMTGDRVVTIWSAALTKLTPDQTRRWLTDYQVSYALLAENDSGTRAALERIGFTATQPRDGFIVMQPALPLGMP